MKLSTKCRYGARALIEIARNYKKGTVKRKDIVKNHNISDSYLENILITLKNAGLINTIRGANGGYVLKKAPEEITFLNIVHVLEGPMDLNDQILDSSSEEKVDTDGTRAVWEKLHASQEKILNSITVRHILESEEQNTELKFNIE